MKNDLPQRLRTKADIAQHIEALVAADPILARAYKIGGVPPNRLAPGGFAALVRIIVHQQVSLASAAAIMQRVERGLGGVSAAAALKASESGLQALGLTKAKARAIHGIAVQLQEGAFSFRRLGHLPDAEAQHALEALSGIGPWSAEIYLLTHMGRADVFPAGDLALQEVVKVLGALPRRPDAEALAKRAEAWQPSRAVAARLLWAAYPKLKD